MSTVRSSSKSTVQPINSNGGVLAYSALDEAFASTQIADDVLTDLCTESNVQHKVTALLHQSIYSRLASYDGTNDAGWLCVDPVMRQVVGGRAVDRRTAWIRQMACVEIEVLTQPQKLVAMMVLLDDATPEKGCM